MNKRLAVIDLGTNTFHIIIVEVIGNGAFKELDRQRIRVSLAEESINRIGAAAFRRGIDALKTFRHKLDIFEVERFRAIGTAALRTAANGLEFLAAAKNETGINIELIDGDEEAAYIYRGVQQAIRIEKPSLIMDIGGGSVELILAGKNGVIDAQSFPVGIAVIFNNFIHSDPVSEEAVSKVFSFLEEATEPFFVRNAGYFPLDDLIGAAGSFEVLNRMMGIPHQAPIAYPAFHQLYEDIKSTTLKERLASDTIPKSRAQMITSALILTEYICRRAGINTILLSEYALKEGAVLEMIKG